MTSRGRHLQDDRLKTVSPGGFYSALIRGAGQRSQVRMMNDEGQVRMMKVGGHWWFQGLQSNTRVLVSFLQGITQTSVWH